MLRFFKGVKKLVFSFSYFQASQYFRFRKSDSYVHISAGLLSLALQIIILISFIYQLVPIFSVKSAIVSTSTSYTFPPTQSTLGLNKGNFMLAIQKVLNANGLVVQFIQNVQTPGNKAQNILGTAQSCTYSHFSASGISQTDFNNNGMNNWLCMPINMLGTIQGAKNSKTYSYLSMDITCPTCTTQNIQLLLHYQVPSIAPGNGKNYLTYYINSDNSISLSSANSYEALQIPMQDYTIESDTTIMPWYSFIYQYGLQVGKLKTSTQSLSAPGYRYQVIINKSTASTVYTRNLWKLMDAFYFMIGSFAPTILVFAFFIYPILSSIFQMRFAKYVYRLQEGKTYGLWSFFKETYYQTFKKLCNLDQNKWQKQQKILEVRQILSKVIIDFLQRSMKFLFKDHHLCGLRLMRKDSILQAQQKYKKYQIRKAIKNYVISQQRKQINQLKAVATNKTGTNKSLVSKSGKSINQEGNGVVSAIPTKKLQSEMLNPKKFTLNIQPRSSKFQPIKQFEINQLDYQAQKMVKRIEDQKDYYNKLIQDFKILKKQAQSYDSKDYIGKMIFEELKQNDIDLMEQFEKKMKKNRKFQQKNQIVADVSPVRSQSMYNSSEMLQFYDDKKKHKTFKEV